MGQRAHLQLSIDVGSEPITGSLSLDSEATRSFAGWIDLAAAIETARSSLATADPRRAGDEDDRSR